MIPSWQEWSLLRSVITIDDEPRVTILIPNALLQKDRELLKGGQPVDNGMYRRKKREREREGEKPATTLNETACRLFLVNGGNDDEVDRRLTVHSSSIE